MKNLTYCQYYDLILKAKKNNPYLYVATYNEAKRNLIPEQFTLLQQKISNAAA
ncbi:hypothetical protein [Wenyingzhuangia sp. 2_MG-2023]|uniref:hypothetical protein n=1 Tax=Wenyingzhuangia sp. 2_MG-2023 TaxID=3062639 RepID=UPI0026E16D2A|nr:hypothetical protein [Wenyingzhuangia sp. 2_MG-2023]MDO6737966.1 hypothetical protein [Wenyingzhuangia sp. 2_MG-2023]MDO6802680.1 hypothetical protein [Wenyingzhuangia sp. 1_MG-2023]